MLLEKIKEIETTGIRYMEVKRLDGQLVLIDQRYSYKQVICAVDDTSVTLFCHGDIRPVHFREAYNQVFHMLNMKQRFAISFETDEVWQVILDGGMTSFYNGISFKHNLSVKELAA